MANVVTQSRKGEADGVDGNRGVAVCSMLGSTGGQRTATQRNARREGRERLTQL